jgi:hypothetical protein
LEERPKLEMIRVGVYLSPRGTSQKSFRAGKKKKKIVGSPDFPCCPVLKNEALKNLGIYLYYKSLESHI